MTSDFESFQPEKRTLGQILSSTSPPIRVPDYQRDFSWGSEQTSDFWSDLVGFAGNNLEVKLTGKEYFLGAAVLVNNGTYHLLLDGQQRLATSTILLAALRDKIREYKNDAAAQIQDQYIVFEDHLTGNRVPKIELNLFDRAFFRDFIQAFPRVPGVIPQKNSHQLIRKAYEYFYEKLVEGWDEAGGGQKGFEWTKHITQALREHIALVTVVSNNERSAAAIFATLNDRGIGLSTVDLIRSWVLQHSDESKREEILQCWDSVFNDCGTAISAEGLIRMSWVAQHGDVKARALYKVVSDSLPGDTETLEYSRRVRSDAALYRQLRDGDTDDGELQDYWLAMRILKFNAGYTLLLSAHHMLTAGEQKKIARALVALVIRHNIVCNLDRAKLESLLYATAKKVTEKASYATVLTDLRQSSPGKNQFRDSFGTLSFSKSEHSIARYLLLAFDTAIAKTREVTVAGPDRVHVEHIYPQSPEPHQKWADHDRYVGRIGNLTLLDRRLNEQIKNGPFPSKKQQAYEHSRLEITKALTAYGQWGREEIQKRQRELCLLAESIWPECLVADVADGAAG